MAAECGFSVIAKDTRQTALIVGKECIEEL
jgi:hypothetical protein